MFEGVKKTLAKFVALQLQCPTYTTLGVFVSRYFTRRHTFLENGAVKLLDIQPDDKVLEIGFGGGVGLHAAYSRVAEGRGIIYGVDRSKLMLERASKLCALEIFDGKIDVRLGLVTHLPYPNAYFDRVFHCNSFFYWKNLLTSVGELKRVMKPGALMVTTMCAEDTKSMLRKGYLNPETTVDVVHYLHALERVGFENVHVEYITDDEKVYQGIFAKKPLQDEEHDEEFLDAQDEHLRRMFEHFHSIRLTQARGRPVDTAETRRKISSTKIGALEDPEKEK